MTTDYEHTPVSVEGKSAVVIGGTSGIGEAIALGFAADGADVIATSRTPEKVASTTAAIEEMGRETAEVVCDVTDRDSLEDLRDRAEATFGTVDVLVNSPGNISRRRILDLTEDDWNDVVDVVLDGVYRACQLFGRTMEDGSIVNISSLAARLSLANAPAYSAAKGGVDAFTRAAAKEFAPDIRVNAIAPGFIITPLNEDVYAEGTLKRERIDCRTPMGRVGNREEMVGAAIYLASDAASYTTGEVLTVDGGFANSAF